MYFRHDIYLDIAQAKREVFCCSVCTFEKYFLVQYAVKSIDLEDHLRKDHLLMEVQVKKCSLDLNVIIKLNQNSKYFTNRTEKFFLGYAKACAPQPGQLEGHFPGKKSAAVGHGAYAGENTQKSEMQ